jgi:1,4-alpha-glucan branching enzyme
MPKRTGKGEAGTPAEAAGKSPKRKTSAKEPTARSIDLALSAPDAKAVAVVGEFNGWNVESHPLQRKDSETWHICLQLPPGTYQYKFVIDGSRWEDDADNPNRTMNEFGTSNSILEVR